MEEQKTIPGWPDYTADRLGNIYSNKNGSVRLLKQRIARKYKYVQLYNNVKVFSKYAHRLLALLFVPNPDNKPCVNHKDGNRLNNFIDNLEWCTQKENIQHAWRTGLKKPYKGEVSGNAKLSEMDVIAARLWVDNKLASRKEVAKRLGVTVYNLWYIINRKTWTHI